jgi:glutaconate CoA-transferase subunit B
VSERFTPSELMAIGAAREIKDIDIIFCGTGLPIVAACAAKKMYAPNSIIFFETGAIDSPLLDLPMFVADSRVMVGAAIQTGLIDAFSMLQNKKIGPRTVSILGGAQVDRFGNLNSTCIGNYASPLVRFSGSGGAADAASLAGRIIVFIKHDKTRFVEKLDYLTSPGWLKGGNSRRSEGLRLGGVTVVITDKCLIRFRENEKSMYVSECFPGCDLKSITENTGFELDVSRAHEMAPPSSEELRILREDVDPENLIIS